VKGTIIRGSKLYSHQSNALAENTVGIIGGIFRSLRLATEKKLNTTTTSYKIDAKHPLVPWLGRHAGWILTRFQNRSWGGSSFKQLFGVEYKGEVTEFAEVLWYRLAARVSSGRGKMEARFAEGVWLGKSEFDDSHLVADTRLGIQTVRTVRRMPIEFRWRGDLLRPGI
jgi:hypothetical protein